MGSAPRWSIVVPEPGSCKFSECRPTLAQIGQTDRTCKISAVPIRNWPMLGETGCARTKSGCDICGKFGRHLPYWAWDQPKSGRSGPNLAETDAGRNRPNLMSSVWVCSTLERLWPMPGNLGVESGHLDRVCADFLGQTRQHMVKSGRQSTVTECGPNSINVGPESTNIDQVWDVGSNLG